tara:strand:- start:2126 stop:2398 length:273 start_codon:yes stop_codon:yes gene_type:complete
MPKSKPFNPNKMKTDSIQTGKYLFFQLDSIKYDDGEIEHIYRVTGYDHNSEPPNFNENHPLGRKLKEKHEEFMKDPKIKKLTTMVNEEIE